MEILGIAGSLRLDSYNAKLLHAAGELIRAAGADFVEYDGLKAVPPYD
jgi:NAD(P)H-dependent FMN reductase